MKTHFIVFKEKSFAMCSKGRFEISGIILRKTALGPVWINPVWESKCKDCRCFIDVPIDKIDEIINALKSIQNERM